MSFNNKITPPSATALFLFMGGGACLLLTALMNRHAGVAQGATDEGRTLLGAGAMVIDLVGIVVFGAVAGNLFRTGKKALATAMLFVTIGCALYSISSIMSFVAGEWLSVSESRRAAVEATKQRHQAELNAAKERREAQERLAQSGLGMMQAQLKDASKKERKVLSKEFAKGASDLVAELGKEQAAKAPEAATDIAIRPDGGAEVISWMTDVPERTVQVIRMAALAVLLIVLKAFAFPVGGYYWARPKMVTTVDAEVISQTLPAPLDAIKLEPPKSQLALPKPPEPVPLRAEPTPEWRALLDAVDFPKKRPGIREPLRAQDKREHVLGLRWLVWIASHGRTGDFTGQDVEALYDEFTKGDNREPWGINVAKSELRTAGKKWITVRDSRSPTVWTIEQPKLAHVRDQLLKRQKAFEQSGCWRGLVPPTEAAPAGKQEAGGDRPGPFGSEACSGKPPPPAANESASYVGRGNAGQKAQLTREPLRGMAQLSRHLPDLGRLARLERVQKAAWQQRLWSVDRKQTNRFSRARGTA